jgi:hypothetical protein
MRRSLLFICSAFVVAGCGGSAATGSYAQGCRGLPTGHRHFVIGVYAPPPSASVSRNSQTPRFLCAHWGAPRSVTRLPNGDTAWRFQGLTLVFKGRHMIGLRNNNSHTLTTVVTR